MMKVGELSKWELKRLIKESIEEEINSYEMDKSLEKTLEEADEWHWKFIKSVFKNFCEGLIFVMVLLIFMKVYC